MILRAILLSLAGGFALSASALASTDKAEKRLQTAVKEVLAVAQRSKNGDELAAGLMPVLEKHLSFDAMTRRAVGPGWRQFSSGQQKEAVKLFTTLVIRSYSSKFEPGQDPIVKFNTATETAPGRVEAPTTVLYKGSRYTVTYRMEASDNWRITDVVIEGVSLIANYRSQFDVQFKQGGANAVLSALAKSVASPK